MIETKRVYDEPSEGDGFRILVDRLWPRGLRKEKAKIDLWLKDIAPSDGLRDWFSHDPSRWREFKRRYYEELKDKAELINAIREKEKSQKVTLLFGAREEKYNNVNALKEYLETQ